jgi:hypothetical protein
MNAFGSSPSPFGQSLFGGNNGQQQSQQPQQQMQNPFMQSSGGGFGGFGQQQMPSYAQNYMSDMGNFGGNQGFGGFQQGGFGGGFNPMQGGFGGGQMQNPFMGGMGGFGGGYSPYQMQNPFMGGMGGFGGGYGLPQRGFGGFGGGMGRDRGFGGGYGRAFAEPQVMPQQPAFLQDQEFQGYRQQSDDLSKQMNEYMQKAPMYQQLQDLQGKMRGVQDRYAPQQNQQGRGQSYEDYLNGPMPAALGNKPMTREEFDVQQTGRLQGGLGTQQQAQDALRQALGGAPRQAQFGQAALGGLSQLLRGQQMPQMQQTTPPGMEMRKGMGGSYYVPTGTPYNPAMD